MQIELTGCTSAGKSTLASGMLQAARQRGIDLLTGEAFVLKRYRLNWVKGRLARTLLIDLFSLLACLTNWRRHKEFYVFALRIISRLPVGWFEKLNLTRNVLKKVGGYEIIQRHGGEQMVLVDEGTLHAAHNLFVHVSVQPNSDDILSFAKRVPVPDLAIYVTHSEEVLIERTLARGHKRIPDCSYENAQRFIERALDTVDQLREQPELAGRLLVIDSRQNLTIDSNDANDPRLTNVLKIVRAGLETVAADRTARPGHRQDAMVSV